MKNSFKLIISGIIITALSACSELKTDQNDRDSKQVEKQQSQYAASQPVPFYDWSLERDMVRQLYNIRNIEAITHSVWRSDLGTIEGDCPSIGFGIPYDTSLTNPLAIENRRMGQGANRYWAEGVVEQSEPNGIFASKNTAATWVMCSGSAGNIEPIYVETRVTTYPYSVNVDYTSNRVTKAGKASVTITSGR